MSDLTGALHGCRVERPETAHKSKQATQFNNGIYMGCVSLTVPLALSVGDAKLDPNLGSNALPDGENLAVHRPLWEAKQL